MNLQWKSPSSTWNTHGSLFSSALRVRKDTREQSDAGSWGQRFESLERCHVQVLVYGLNGIILAYLRRWYLLGIRIRFSQLYVVQICMNLMHDVKKKTLTFLFAFMTCKLVQNLIVLLRKTTLLCNYRLCLILYACMMIILTFVSYSSIYSLRVSLVCGLTYMSCIGF